MKTVKFEHVTGDKVWLVSEQRLSLEVVEYGRLYDGIVQYKLENRSGVWFGAGVVFLKTDEGLGTAGKQLEADI